MTTSQDQTLTGYTVLENGRLLRRYAYIERVSLRILAAWLPEIEQWEIKKAVGRHLWDEAQHADRLYQRLRELRGGHPTANAEAGVAYLMQEALHAPSAAALIAGLYLTIKRRLLDTYRRHIERASYVVDAPTVDGLEQIVADEARHLAWAENALPELSKYADQAEVEGWSAYLARLLETLGDLNGLTPIPSMTFPERPDSYRPFKRSGQARRDERFTLVHISEIIRPLEELEALPLRENEIAAFRIYFTEMWAAELVASVIVDAEDMPWEFYHDLARHAWDEIRHCDMGEQRLKELGIGISDYPTSASEYDRRVRMPWLHRYCDLTMLGEARYIHVRPPRVRRYLREGALRSAELADYDWSDEIQHVAFGTKWLRYVLRDDARSLEDLIEECEALRVQMAEESPEFRLPPHKQARPHANRATASRFSADGLPGQGGAS